MMKQLICCLIVLCPAAAFAADAVSDLKSDEVVEFFPTYGYADPDTKHHFVSIRAWVYEPATNSTTAYLFWKALGLDEKQAQNHIFKERANRFLVDSERGKQIVIRFAGQNHTLARTGANGHTETTLRLSEPPGSPRRSPAPALDYQAVLSTRDTRKFAGRVHLIPPTGISVISDIDDTIKVSQVRDKQALLNNTFLREFEPVSGMEKVYQAWARQGAAFHYVTGGPWQLFAPLEAFREKSGFPAATFHMRQFRLKDSSAWSMLASPSDYKLRTIEPILKSFPKRQFILVGDSGEKDPEVYAALARKFPDQIAKIFIRDVTNEPADAARYAECFKEVPRDRWVVFRKTDEIAGYRP
jgi:hypothetical protein